MPMYRLDRTDSHCGNEQDGTLHPGLEIRTATQLCREGRAVRSAFGYAAGALVCVLWVLAMSFSIVAPGWGRAWPCKPVDLLKTEELLASRRPKAVQDTGQEATGQKAAQDHWHVHSRSASEGRRERIPGRPAVELMHRSFRGRTGATTTLRTGSNCFPGAKCCCSIPSVQDLLVLGLPPLNQCTPTCSQVPSPGSDSQLVLHPRCQLSGELLRSQKLRHGDGSCRSLCRVRTRPAGGWRLFAASGMSLKPTPRLP